MFPPNYLQGQSKMDVKYQTTWNFFFSAKLSTLFHFPTRKIGNFWTFTHPTPILFSSATWVISPTTSLNHQLQLYIPEDKKKTHTTPLKYTANSVCHLLGSWTFFSVTFCLKKKNVPRGTQKEELNRTLCLFLLICFCSFFYVCIFHCLYFALSCCDTRGSFLSFPFSYNFVYRISGTPYLKFWGQPM